MNKIIPIIALGFSIGSIVLYANTPQLFKQEVITPSIWTIKEIVNLVEREIDRLNKHDYEIKGTAEAIFKILFLDDKKLFEKFIGSDEDIEQIPQYIEKKMAELNIQEQKLNQTGIIVRFKNKDKIKDELEQISIKKANLRYAEGFIDQWKNANDHINARTVFLKKINEDILPLTFDAIVNRSTFLTEGENEWIKVTELREISRPLIHQIYNARTTEELEEIYQKIVPYVKKEIAISFDAKYNEFKEKNHLSNDQMYMLFREVATKLEQQIPEYSPDIFARVKGFLGFSPSENEYSWQSLSKKIIPTWMSDMWKSGKEALYRFRQRTWQHQIRPGFERSLQRMAPEQTQFGREYEIERALEAGQDFTTPLKPSYGIYNRYMQPSMQRIEQRMQQSPTLRRMAEPSSKAQRAFERLQDVGGY